MASSRKPPSASLAVALSGGVDSVVLLHLLKARGFSLQAVHVHHGLSPNADAWAGFCAKLCRRWGISFSLHRVNVRKSGKGLEAAAREARYAVFRKLPQQGVVLAHHLDDQAETVLMNLLRGAGSRGASGMAPVSDFHGKTLLRPLLDIPRSAILAYARRHRLDWVEDESNADEALTRNFIRRRIGPLLEAKYPKWRESLARAARHFSQRELGKEDLLRSFLQSNGMKAPSEAKLVEMLKQLAASGSATRIDHDGSTLRVYREKIFLEKKNDTGVPTLQWKGQSRLALPGGELHFRRVRGGGFDAGKKPLTVRARSGGERLQPDPRRPRRTLKNLFQEAGVPPWQRDQLPMLYSGTELVWVPGLGIDARFQTAPKRSGWVPEWRPNSLFL
ncbi:MAG TPA: tRNA lysidine(34) synthetase TilS [Burkholderiales bacterium]